MILLTLVAYSSAIVPPSITLKCISLPWVHTSSLPGNATIDHGRKLGNQYPSTQIWKHVINFGTGSCYQNHHREAELIFECFNDVGRLMGRLSGLEITHVHFIRHKLTCDVLGKLNAV